MKHEHKICVTALHMLVVPPSKEDLQRLFSLQVIKKLQKDIVAVIYDDVTLSHVIDEVLTFSQEFYHLGVEEDALPLLVLLEPVIFTKWLSLERKFAFAKIDDMMLDEQSWTSSPARQEISKCTETFAILLQSITNR